MGLDDFGDEHEFSTEAILRRRITDLEQANSSLQYRCGDCKQEILKRILSRSKHDGTVNIQDIRDAFRG